MPRTVSRREVVRVEDGRARRRTDTLAAEEPLEIRVDGRPVSVTMRTPGDDVDLALGFLVTEGVVSAAADVATARHCTGQNEPNELNVLDVRLRGAAELPASLQRNFYVTSACGVCGKASIDAVFAHIHRPLHADPAHVAAEVLTELPETLRRAQRVFDRTGGLHAAALFDTRGELACVREDVGRHNAVDKVVGWAAREDRLPLSGSVLLVSGRASFELVQKAAMAGVPVLAAVGAPSGLAASLADEVGMTLVGFLRGPSMNVYTHPHRVGAPG